MPFHPFPFLLGGFFRHGIFLLSVFHQSIKSNVTIGIFFCNFPLAAARAVFSLPGMLAASLRKLSNTLLSLPNTPLLIHSSAESGCVSSFPKWSATAEIAVSAPMNRATAVHEPVPPNMTVSAEAPNTQPAPFSNLLGR